jgi:hypothetical protein
VVNEATDANPKGVEFPSLSMFNPFRGWVVNGAQPRVPLGASPVAIQTDPLRGCCKAVSKIHDRIYEAQYQGVGQARYSCEERSPRSPGEWAPSIFPPGVQEPNFFGGIDGK